MGNDLFILLDPTWLAYLLVIGLKMDMWAQVPPKGHTVPAAVIVLSA